jgi:TRAP-type C4-dicarboxylate transport system substrate-binding protein
MRYAFRCTVVVLAAAIGAITVAGCSSGGADKAGGGLRTPRVLQLTVNVGSHTPARSDIDYFARQVENASHGKLRIRVSFQRDVRDPSDPSFESAIARGVRDGRLDLGWIGAAGWDRVGVESLRALQAPFLVTDYALLGRVVTGSIAARMLGGLRRAGVVGLALVPGVLSHPVGYRRALVGLGDYKGARVGDVASNTTDALLRAFGAKPVNVTGNQALITGRVEAVAADSETEEETGGCSARCAWVIGSTVTTNVTLFANAETVIANPRVLERLSHDQRDSLRRAATRTAARAAHQPPDESAGFREFCNNNGYAVTASDRDLAELRRAAAPIDAQLARDPQTAHLIRDIRALKASTPARAPTAPAGCTPGERARATGPRRPSSMLNGTYRYVITKHDALTRGDPTDKTAAGVARYPAVVTQILRDGKWLGGGDCSCESNGTYTITGSHLDFDWVPVHYHLHFAFSRDTDGTLHLTPLPPMENGDRFVFSTEPWRRVGPPIVKSH